MNSLQKSKIKMKDSLRFSFFLVLILALSASAQAQPGSSQPVATPDGAYISAPALIPQNPVGAYGTRDEKPKSYADSAEFAKAFKELYPLVKQPKLTIRQFAEKQVEYQLKALIRQGADSAKVVKTAYVGLDEDAAYKLYYQVYREKLTAKEIKAYAAFLKTPEGQKIIEANAELGRAPAEVNSYVMRTVNTNLMPFHTEMRDKAMKQQKEYEERMKTDTTDAGKQYRRQMEMRDSIMKARGINIQSGTLNTPAGAQVSTPPSGGQ
jgi:hypothetical protein